MNALDEPLDGSLKSRPMRAPLFGIVFLALTAAILTGFDWRTGLSFALVCVYFGSLTIHLESGIYIILAAAAIFIDGWTPNRSQDDVFFRLGLGRLYIMEITVYGLVLMHVLKRKFGSSLISRGSVFSSTPLDRPLCVFAALMPVFAVYGLLRGNPLQQAIGYYEWRCLLLAIVFYFLVVTFADTRAKTMRYFWWFVALVTAKASYSLFLYLLGIQGPLPVVFGSGPVGEVAENYMFIFVALAALSLLFYGRKIGIEKRSLAIAAATLTIINVLISQKRDPQLGLAVGLVTLGWRLPFKQKLKWGGCFATVAIIVFLATSIWTGKSGQTGIAASTSRYTEFSEVLKPLEQRSSEGETISFHILDWVDGLAAISQHPILGEGFGGAYERNLTLLTFGEGQWIEPGMVHNQYLTFWLKMGAFGLAAYVWLFVSFFRFARSGIPRMPNNSSQAVCLGLYAAIWGDVLMEMWSPVWIANTKFPLVVLFSMAVVASLVFKNRNSVSPGPSIARTSGDSVE